MLSGNIFGLPSVFVTSAEESKSAPIHKVGESREQPTEYDTIYKDFTILDGHPNLLYPQFDNDGCQDIS